jgi:hypothetical protein
MKSAFVTPEVLSEYLSLSVDLLDDFVRKGIIDRECYFQVGNIRRYSVEKVEKSLIEYTKRYEEVEQRQNSCSQSHEVGMFCNCDKYKEAISVLEKSLYAVAKSRDDVLQLLHAILEPIWDFDFNTSIIGAWRKEISSLLEMCEENRDLKRNIHVIIGEMEDYDEGSNYHEVIKKVLWYTENKKDSLGSAV